MAGIVAYDTIVVQQGQCLMDVALQHYGTADPQALIALMQDNELDGVTANLKAGDRLKIRNNAEFANKKIVEYYHNNKTNIATSIENTTIQENLIANVVRGNSGNWNDPNFSFIGDYMPIEIDIMPKHILIHDILYNLNIRTNYPITGNIVMGDTGTPISLQQAVDYNIQLMSGIDASYIRIYAGYGYVGVEYNIKLILTQL